jgi:hypothetical protein
MQRLPAPPAGSSARPCRWAGSPWCAAGCGTAGDRCPPSPPAGVQTYVVIASRHQFAAGSFADGRTQDAFSWAEEPALSRLVLPPELESRSTSSAAAETLDLK